MSKLLSGLIFGTLLVLPSTLMAKHEPWINIQENCTGGSLGGGTLWYQCDPYQVRLTYGPREFRKFPGNFEEFRNAVIKTEGRIFEMQQTWWCDQWGCDKRLDELNFDPSSTAPEDTDGDGIYDSGDLCPNTPPNAKVWTFGRLKGCVRT